MSALVVYHLDRARSLKEGDIIDLIPTQELLEAYQKEYVTYLFGEKGVSKFGMVYTRDNRDSLEQPINWFTETVFEYVRRIQFPAQPSRFQSFFSVPTEEDARKWQSYFEESENPIIWGVQVNDAVALDATWRDVIHKVDDKVSFDPAFCYYNAVNYWSGVRTNNPRIEVLSSLPVRVFAEIIY